MKILSFIISILITFSIQDSFAQFKLLPAESPEAQSGNGIFYSLPLTVLKVDIVMSVTEKIPGPFKEFSNKYLGIDDVIENESTDYEIINIDIKPVIIPDRSNSYFIYFGSNEKSKEKDAKPVYFNITPQGFFKSFNLPQSQELKNEEKEIETSREIYIIGDDSEDFRYEAEYNKKLVIDTVIRKITIDTMTINKFVYRTNWTNKTTEERADDAAKQIEKIRESRFNLLTGYHEVNFSGSIKYMDYELKKLENQYLELFLGKELKTVKHYTVFFAPDKNILVKELFKSNEGDQLLLRVSPVNELNIKDAQIPVDNAIVYRQPADCEVSVLFNRKKVFDDIFPISQLGSKMMIKTDRQVFELDPVSGAPIKIKKY